MYLWLYFIQYIVKKFLIDLVFQQQYGMAS